MTIRFIGGLWRRIDSNSIRSFCTYGEAVENKICWEDLSPQTTSDDIAKQMELMEQQILTSQTRKKNRVLPPLKTASA